MLVLMKAFNIWPKLEPHLTAANKHTIGENISYIYLK